MHSNKRALLNKCLQTSLNTCQNSHLHSGRVICHFSQNIAPKQFVSTAVGEPFNTKPIHSSTVETATRTAHPQYIPQSTDYHFSEHAQRLEETVLHRYAAKHFIPDKQIPPQVLSHILALAQRAPSGYNLQPWTAIVVNNEQKKQELYEAALRQQKILEAPVTIVIAANHGRPLENLETVLDQGRESGTMTEEQIDRVRRLSQALLNTGPLCALQLAKFLFTTAISMFYKPMMVAPLNMKAYIWKQTVLAADILMLAASAHGIQSCPMEGFDERRVKNVVGLPSNYSVPLIVSLGYSSEHLEGRKRTPRLDPEKQFFQNIFGEKMDNLVSMNEDFSDFLKEFRDKYGDLSTIPAELPGTTVESTTNLPIEESLKDLPITETPRALPIEEEAKMLPGQTVEQISLPPPK